MTPVHYFLALAYLDLKQEQPAIAEFEKVIHTPYVTPEMYNALASLYIRKKQFAEAEDLCRKAIVLNSARPDAYLNLARVYNAQRSERTRRWRFCARYCRRARGSPCRSITRDCRRILR